MDFIVDNVPKTDLSQQQSTDKALHDFKNVILEDLEENSNLLHQTELQERLIVLNASLKTLRDSIIKEKELWREEVKQTIDLENKMSETLTSRLQSGDYTQQFEMLTNAFLKSQTKIQNEINSSVYKRQLLEAENMCNLEMLRIRNSLECLAPLRAMVGEWKCEAGEVGENDNNVVNSRSDSQ